MFTNFMNTIVYVLAILILPYCVVFFLGLPFILYFIIVIILILFMIYKFSSENN